MSNFLQIRDANGLLAALDRGLSALAECRDDYERLRIRDQAAAVEAAAKILKRKDISNAARLLVIRCERDIAEANPAQQGKRTDLVYCKYCYKHVNDLGGECGECGARLEPEELLTPGVRSCIPEKDLSLMRTAHEALPTEADFASMEADVLAGKRDAPSRSELVKVTRSKRREERATQKDAEFLACTPSSNVDLHHLPVSELHTVVPAKSVDVIFTDPPYPREYLPVWSELAAFASHALKPSGVLVAMSGQSYLPEVMASLGEHLTYRWTMAYLMPGADTTIWPRKIKTRWKPVLVYGAAEEWLNMDVVHADTLKAQDDRFHQWGQQAPGVVRLLEQFVKPGYVVCDPFVGGGTSALAAQVHGCAFIGADSDAMQLDTTRKRSA